MRVVEVAGILMANFFRFNTGHLLILSASILPYDRLGSRLSSFSCLGPSASPTAFGQCGGRFGSASTCAKGLKTTAKERCCRGREDVISF